MSHFTYAILPLFSSEFILPAPVLSGFAETAPLAKQAYKPDGAPAQARF